ncbi:hypothetical protein CPB85DRAFT_1430146 [Mucidula mucida]|nr:hypothetical protein CPB85DRAFT_1430146 [Mucidula mucida]
MTFKRRLPPPPRFVPATIQDGEWNVYQPPQSAQQQAPSNQIAGWYKSLNRASTTSTPSTSGSSTPAPRSSRATAENNLWFIRNAIRSEPTSSRPPQLPSLIFLLENLRRCHLNPSSNRLFSLPLVHPTKASTCSKRAVGTKAKLSDQTLSGESGCGSIHVLIERGNGEHREVRKVSFVDLTLSDSESGSQSDSDGDSESSEPAQDATEQLIPPPSSSSDRKALITPLPPS